MNLKWHHLGILGAITLAPGWYATRQAVDFFYTRREAMTQISRIDEMAGDRKLLLDKLEALDNKVSRIQGLLEAYFARKQLQKSKVFGDKLLKSKITEGG